jgi:D-alanyl-D-alanine carboxypeptidase/D-alanyl-D-alanine-endopeptidase (penicillin-binding protein 4)
MTRRLSSTVILFTCLVALTACRSQTQGHDPALESQLSPILHKRDSSGAIFTARVVEVATGRELYAERIDEPFTPASNMKLATGATGLDLCGKDYRFKTYLAMDGDDLWIIGTGDPACGDPLIAKKTNGTPVSMLDEWADALVSKGIHDIRGNLYYYDGALEAQQIHPKWSKSFLTDWYAAPVSGLNFNDNCVDITVFPTTSGQPVRYEVMPPVKNIQVNNLCKTGPGTPDIDRAQQSNLYILKGSTNEKKTLQSKPVTDPAAFFADAFRTHLESRKIRVEGETKRADKPLGGKLVPPKDKILAVHETAMFDLLSRINKQSQNLFAEALCKMTGREFQLRKGKDVPGSWENGAEAIHAFLKKQGIDDSKYHLQDGSGLGRENTLSARMQTDLLVKMTKHPAGEMFRESMAEAGKDGTIGKRMKDLEGHVYAKTGYIGGVRALSGYIYTRQHQWLVFSIIYNKIPGDVKPFEQLQDDACRVLVNWPNLKPLPSTQPVIAEAR